MCKTQALTRKTIVVVKNNEKYRLFTDDLKKILKVRKLRAPPLPPYEIVSNESEEDSPIAK